MPYKDIEKQRAWQREAKRKARAGRAAERKRLTAPVHLDTADKVRCMLEKCVAEVEADGVESAMKARIFCRIGEVCLRAIDMGELERRLTVLETAINANTQSAS